MSPEIYDLGNACFRISSRCSRYLLARLRTGFASARYSPNPSIICRSNFKPVLKELTITDTLRARGQPFLCHCSSERVIEAHPETAATKNNQDNTSTRLKIRHILIFTVVCTLCFCLLVGGDELDRVCCKQMITSTLTFVSSFHVFLQMCRWLCSWQPSHLDSDIPSWSPALGRPRQRCTLEYFHIRRHLRQWYTLVRWLLLAKVSPAFRSSKHHRCW